MSGTVATSCNTMDALVLQARSRFSDENPLQSTE